MNRSLKLVFVASLLLNILLAGIILGHASRYAMHDKKNSAEVSLPENERDHYRETMRQIDQAADAMRAKLDVERSQAADLLKTEPFNVKAYKDQMDKLSVARAEMVLRLADIIATRASESSLAERTLMAEKMRKPPVIRKPRH